MDDNNSEIENRRRNRTSNKPFERDSCPAAGHSPLNDGVLPREMIMKKCTFCAEDIQNDAIKCKHCGEFLDASTPHASQKKRFHGISENHLLSSQSALWDLWRCP